MIHRFLIRRRALIAAVLGCVFLSIAWSAEELPAQLSDEAFWKLVTEYSEPGGTFVSDNFVSNELLFQHVLMDLTQDRKPGGVYLGVGPEQNFTYIVALKPKIAFVLDIRRQNLIEHLMYKALFELSADRVEFLSRLFSRPRPANLTKESSIDAIFSAFRDIMPDPRNYEENLRAIKDRLIKDHGFALTPEDQGSLEYVYRAFYVGGPNLTYSGPRTGNVRGVMPTYEELMMGTDSNGKQRSYMTTEESFATLQQMEKNNLLVPLVGDFAGPMAIRSVGQYLRDHNSILTAFYTSNVEQYRSEERR